MWVRSLSLPPPHPLVLTGKGRSFLQPKLPTKTLSLSLCALPFPYYLKVRVFADFTAVFLWWLVPFLFYSLVLCSFWGGGGLHSTQLCHWLCLFSTVICMVLCISNLDYGYTHGSLSTVQTYTGSSLFLHECPLNITKNRCVPSPSALHPQILMPVSAQPEFCCLFGAWLNLYSLPLCACIHRYIHVYVCICVSHHPPTIPHYLVLVVRRRWPMV